MLRKNPFSAIGHIFRQVNDSKLTQTYFPEEKLKSRWSIILDHLVWLVRHKEVNRYYFIYGLDRKKSTATQDVLPYNEFRRIRDKTNLKPAGKNFNYASLLRDKFLFGQYLTSLKFPTPRNIALFEKGNITWLSNMRTEPLSALNNTDEDIDGFCKQLTGLMGEGAFPLRISGGKIYTGEKEISTDELHSKINGQYLWQERIIQHEKMSALHPSSVNTIRLISFNNNNRIEIFSGTLRVGAKSNRVDNWNAGGIAFGIDLPTGRVRRKGVYKPGYGTGVEVHPDSGIRLEGFQIPFFEESMALTKRLHEYFYGTHSIGWDLALTPQGPVFVEGNDDWDGCMPMSLEENFKNRFLKMYDR